MESSKSSSLPVHILPVVIAVWIPLSCAITYLIAVHNSHVYPWWPSISATGALPPDSCFFSFFFNISTFTLLAVGYLRHYQLKEFTRCSPESGPGSWTIMASSIFGFFSVLGLYFIANWQVVSDPKVHYTGAELCFFCGNIYFIFQTVFSYWMAPQMNSLFTCGLRGTFTFLMILCIIVCNYSNYESVTHFPGHNATIILHWDPEMPYYSLHIVYTSLEWALMFFFALTISTFYPDFKRIRLEEPVLKLRRKWNDDEL